MANSYAVEDFIAGAIADGRITVEQRDRLWRIAESGANASALLSYLRDLGYTSGLQTVINWKEGRFGEGELAREINAWTRQARGLMPSDALNQLAYWMLTRLSEMYTEIGNRDLKDVKTNQLMLMFATYATRVQEAIAQSEKVRSLADSKELILATLEEVRMSWRQTHEAENPELLSIIDDVLNMVKSKLDV